MFKPVDAASAIAFRVLFGLVMAASMVRLIARGFVDELYVAPAYHFRYWGFEWLPMPPVYPLVVALAVVALLLAAGVMHRVCAALFFVGFTWLELVDVTNYLNHYYFVSLVALLLVFMPLERGRATVPAWVVWTLRLQLGLVYVFAGVAKLDTDWLLHAEPLRTWLAARLEWTHPVVPYAMSWGGALFDLSIFGALLWSRTRPFAYTAVVGFHVVTWLLFNIGMFPWIMIAATTIFFAPSWPRRFGLRSGDREGPSSRSHFVVLVLAVHFTVQLVLPLRHLAYPGDVNWTEEGARYAWRVMLVEKTGLVEFRVVEPTTGRTWRIDPRDELTVQQTKMMSTQPDLILQYAHHLAERFGGNVEVYADAWCSLNGRPSARLIDPAVDLARERDSLAPKTWIVRDPL
jgi:vitamin K-dependent gamma-carboxylase